MALKDFQASPGAPGVQKVNGIDPRRRLGVALRSARAKHRPDVITVEGWARVIGYSKDYVSGVETGNHRPSRQFVEAYEKACGLSDTSLVSLYDEVRGDDSPVPRPHPVARPKRRLAITTAAVGSAVILAAMIILRTGESQATSRAQIDAPIDGIEVCYEAAVTGMWNDVPPDEDLWLVVKPLLTGLHYPQPGPVARHGQRTHGTWFGSAYLGERDKGVSERFEILVLSAATPVSRTLVATHQTHSGLGGLPTGAELLDVVHVTRAAC